MNPANLASLPAEIILQIFNSAARVSLSTLLALAQSNKAFYALYLSQEDRFIRTCVGSGNFHEMQMLFCMLTLSLIVECHKVVTGYTSRSKRRTENKYCKESECLTNDMHKFVHQHPSFYSDFISSFPLSNFPEPKVERQLELKWDRSPLYRWSAHLYLHLGSYSKTRNSNHHSFIDPLKTLLSTIPTDVVKKAYSLHTRFLAQANLHLDPVGRNEDRIVYPHADCYKDRRLFLHEEGWENFYKDLVLGVLSTDVDAMERLVLDRKRFRTGGRAEDFRGIIEHLGATVMIFYDAEKGCSIFPNSD